MADRFQPVASNGYCYLLLADGGKVQFYQTATETFEQLPIRGETTVAWEFTITPTALIDPYGLVTTLTFGDYRGSLTQVTEPGGRWLKISYGASSSPGISVITSVQAGYDATVTQSVTYSYSTFTAGAFSYPTLTGVSYSDGTSASYTYQAANTYPNTGPPLINTCNDVRYPGPMKKIAYEFAAQSSESSGGIYGEFAIARHWLYPEPAAVSYWLGGHVETRGDGPQRSFFFGSNSNRPQYLVPQPYLLSQYTDFKGSSSFLGYDQNTFVSDFEDANAHVTNFTRTFTGKIQTLTRPPDATGVRSSIQFAYTDPVYGYYLQSKTDELGHATVYQRDGSNRVKEIDYPDSGTETFTYGGFGQVLTHKMTSGGMEAFDYDNRGLRQSYRDPYHDPVNKTGKPTFWYQYDALDRVSGRTDSRGTGAGDANYTTNYAYNQRGQLTTTTHPIDATTGARYTVVNAYNPDSTLASVTDEAGNATTYAYDDFKRLTSITPPIAFAGDTTPRTTNYYYDHTGGTATDYTHADNSVRLSVTPLGNRSVTQYDQNLRKISTTAGNGAEAATTSYSYDPAGNLKTVTQPYNQGYTTSSCFYDPRNRLTDVDDALNRNRLGHTISWTYDQAGNKKTQLRANNQLVTYDQYDAMNRLQAESVQRDTNTIDQTAMTYDVAGNLTNLIDARQKQYTFAYDLLNRKINTVYTDRKSIERYHYDLANNLDSHTARTAEVQAFTYDNRNRKTGASAVLWANARSFTYDPVGNLTNANTTNGGDTDDFTYDWRNRKTSETQMAAGPRVRRTVSYTYDADSNRKTMTYPSGLVLTYNYDTRGELLNENDGSGAVVSYTYDLNGNRSTRALRNGTSTTYYRDLLDLVFEIQHKRGASEFAGIDYSYDILNRIYWRNTREESRGQSYTYYLDDQLKSATFDGTGINDPAPVNSTSLAYDGNGNWTTQTNRSTPSYTYTVDDMNEYTLVNQSTVWYDANGNLGTYNGLTLDYDGRNRLTTAQNSSNSVNFYYDALDRQLLRNVNGRYIYSIWDGWNLIEEWNDSNQLLHANVHGAASDEMVERHDVINGAVQNRIWYYQDAQGSTTHLADDSGNVIEKYKYDPALSGAPYICNASGQQLPTSAYDNRFLYTGRDWLKEVGLYDYRNRFYFPVLARFLQPDPIRLAGDSRNLYRYCRNNSINNTDPFGLQDLPNEVDPPPSPPSFYDDYDVNKNFIYDPLARWLFNRYAPKLPQPPAPLPPDEPVPPYVPPPTSNDRDPNGNKVPNSNEPNGSGGGPEGFEPGPVGTSFDPPPAGGVDIWDDFRINRFIFSVKVGGG